MARLADFAKDRKGGWGVPLASIANLDVKVWGYSTTEGKFGTVYIMDVELPSGERVSVYTSGTVIARSLEQALEADAFPVEARFVKRKRYWEVE
jgi:hypothetical protein